MAEPTPVLGKTPKDVQRSRLTRREFLELAAASSAVAALAGCVPKPGSGLAPTNTIDVLPHPTATPDIEKSLNEAFADPNIQKKISDANANIWIAGRRAGLEVRASISTWIPVWNKGFNIQRETLTTQDNSVVLGTGVVDSDKGRFLSFTLSPDDLIKDDQTKIVEPSFVAPNEKGGFDLYMANIIDNSPTIKVVSAYDEIGLLDKDASLSYNCQYCSPVGWAPLVFPKINGEVDKSQIRQYSLGRKQQKGIGLADLVNERLSFNSSQVLPVVYDSATTTIIRDEKTKNITAVEVKNIKDGSVERWEYVEKEGRYEKIGNMTPFNTDKWEKTAEMDFPQYRKDLLLREEAWKNGKSPSLETQKKWEQDDVVYNNIWVRNTNTWLKNQGIDVSKFDFSKDSQITDGEKMLWGLYKWQLAHKQDYLNGKLTNEQYFPTISRELLRYLTNKPSDMKVYETAMFDGGLHHFGFEFDKPDYYNNPDGAKLHTGDINNHNPTFEKTSRVFGVEHKVFTKTYESLSAIWGLMFRVEGADPNSKIGNLGIYESNGKLILYPKIANLKRIDANGGFAVVAGKWKEITSSCPVEAAHEGAPGLELSGKVKPFTLVDLVNKQGLPVREKPFSLVDILKASLSFFIDNGIATVQSFYSSPNTDGFEKVTYPWEISKP